MIPCNKCKPLLINGYETYPCGKSKIEIKRLIFALSTQKDFPYNPSLKNVAQKRINEANNLKTRCPQLAKTSATKKEPAFKKATDRQQDYAIIMDYSKKMTDKRVTEKKEFSYNKFRY